MPFAEDLTPFFNVEDFGSAALYNGTTTVNGIFDREYLEALDGVAGSGPAFTCRTADVPSAANGDTLAIASVTYTVRGVESDGTGVTLLRLEAP